MNAPTAKPSIKAATLRLREALQRAALAPDEWPDALAALTRLTGADSVVMFLPTGNAELGVATDFISHNTPDVSIASKVAQETGRFDALVEGGERLGLLGANWQGRCRDLITDRDWDENPHRAYFDAADWRHYLGFITSADPANAVPAMHFSLFRSRKGGVFTDEQCALLAELRDSLHFSAAMSFRLRAANQRASLAEAGLNQLADAVWLVDANGRVVFANAVAEAAIRRGDVLRSKDGRLQAATPEGDTILQHALRRLAMGLTAQARIEGIKRRSLLVSFSPTQGLTGAVAGVVIAPGPAPTGALRERLKAQYNLTPTEIEIAVKLASAEKPASIAEERGRSVHTIRTQLRDICLKMGVNRQPELVRLLNALSND